MRGGLQNHLESSVEGPPTAESTASPAFTSTTEAAASPDMTSTLVSTLVR